MMTIVLELDDEILDKVMQALKDIPLDKIKISTLKKDKSEELSKIKNPWEMLRAMSGTIEGESDESVEHDHYIRNSAKINEK